MFFREDLKGNYKLNLEVTMSEQETFFFEKQEVSHEPMHHETVFVPISIFRKGFSGLQVIVKFLVEKKGLSFSKIAFLLGRDQRTIWSSYAQVKNKKVEFFPEVVEDWFDVSLIKNRDFSVLEHICFFLKNKNNSLTDIGLVLGKSPKTIWTVLSRFDKKFRGGKK